MTYREDPRAHCAECFGAMADGEGLFTKLGLFVCRTCANAALIAETNRELAAHGQSEVRGASRPGSKAGFWFLAPAGFFAICCVAQLLDHIASGDGCSELSCLGLVLLPWLGMAVALPCTLLAVATVPAAARGKCAAWGFGAILLMLGTCAGAA